MATKIYVGGLSSETTEQELSALFSQHGDVASVDIVSGSDSENIQGYAFVVMFSAEEAQKAMTKLHNKDFGGRKLTVNQARPMQDRQRGSLQASADGFRRQ